MGQLNYSLRVSDCSLPYQNCFINFATKLAVLNIDFELNLPKFFMFLLSHVSEYVKHFLHIYMCVYVRARARACARVCVCVTKVLFRRLQKLRVQVSLFGDHYSFV